MQFQPRIAPFVRSLVADEWVLAHNSRRFQSMLQINGGVMDWFVEPVSFVLLFCALPLRLGCDSCTMCLRVKFCSEMNRGSDCEYFSVISTPERFSSPAYSQNHHIFLHLATSFFRIWSQYRLLFFFFKRMDDVFQNTKLRGPQRMTD